MQILDVRASLDALPNKGNEMSVVDYLSQTSFTSLKAIFGRSGQ